MNQFIFKKISAQLEEKAININRGIVHWATPATWYQKYPQRRLESIEGKCMAELFGKGWLIKSNFVKNIEEMIR